MNSRPTHASTDGHVYLSLQNKARQTRRNTQDLLRLYALEGFLARLAISDHETRLVLKGGVLLAAYGLRRATRDIDLQARRVLNDTNTILEIARDVAAIDLDDGLIYLTDSATAGVIREEGAYQGVRISLSATLATARIILHVDINVGDPIWPAPQLITVPGILGRDIELHGYPLTMVHAEKLVTAIDRGTTNTRWRDFADVYMLSGHHPADSIELRASIGKVAEYRGVLLQPLSRVLDGWPEQAQPRWAVWLSKQDMPSDVPRLFAEVVAAIEAFADPILMEKVGSGTWDPAARAWRA
jgi:hypothetical protein